MGRGDRPPHPRPHLRRPVARRPRYLVVLASEAEDELVELISYIARERPQNARAILQAILERRDRLRTNPRLGHADPNAPLVPDGAAALLTTTKGIALYYLFPLKHGDRELVFVVSVRRGARQPLDQPDYARRWLAELADLGPGGRGKP